MTIETWKDEFYPIAASVPSLTNDVARLEHSIKKWEGLRPKNVAKHDLIISGDSLFCKTYGYYQYFDINADTCALCVAHRCCTGCPLFKTLGKQCDKGTAAPYAIFIETGDPEPMIKALKETLVNLKDAKNTEGHTAVSIIA